MADFCNHCVERVFPGEKPDIDVYAIFKELKPGYLQQVLCEGCGMFAIVKTEDKELKVIYANETKSNLEVNNGGNLELRLKLVDYV